MSEASISAPDALSVHVFLRRAVENRRALDHRPVVAAGDGDATVAVALAPCSSDTVTVKLSV